MTASVPAIHRGEPVTNVAANRPNSSDRLLDNLRGTARHPGGHDHRRVPALAPPPRPVVAANLRGDRLVAPRTWTVHVSGRSVEVVAGTQEAAEKIAARRIAQGRL